MITLYATICFSLAALGGARLLYLFSKDSDDPFLLVGYAVFAGSAMLTGFYLLGIL